MLQKLNRRFRIVSFCLASCLMATTSFGQDDDEPEKAAEPVEITGAFSEANDRLGEAERGEFTVAGTSNQRPKLVGNVIRGANGQLLVVLPLDTLSRPLLPTLSTKEVQPQRSVSNGEDSEALQDSSALDATSRSLICTHCAGAGRYLSGFNWKRCGKCGGSGRIGGGNSGSSIQIVTSPYIDSKGYVWSGSGSGGSGGKKIRKASIKYVGSKAYWYSSYSNIYGRVSDRRAPSQDRLEFDNVVYSKKTTINPNTGEVRRTSYKNGKYTSSSRIGSAYIKYQNGNWGRPYYQYGSIKVWANKPFRPQPLNGNQGGSGNTQGGGQNNQAANIAAGIIQLIEAASRGDDVSTTQAADPSEIDSLQTFNEEATSRPSELPEEAAGSIVRDASGKLMVVIPLNALHSTLEQEDAGLHELEHGERDDDYEDPEEGSPLNFGARNLDASASDDVLAQLDAESRRSIPCTKCGTTGYYATTEMRQIGFVKTKVPVRKRCDRCGGDGWVSMKPLQDRLGKEQSQREQRARDIAQSLPWDLGRVDINASGRVYLNGRSTSYTAKRGRNKSTGKVAFYYNRLLKLPNGRNAWYQWYRREGERSTYKRKMTSR